MIFKVIFLFRPQGRDGNIMKISTDFQSNHFVKSNQIS